MDEALVGEVCHARGHLTTIAQESVRYVRFHRLLRTAQNSIAIMFNDYRYRVHGHQRCGHTGVGKWVGGVSSLKEALERWDAHF